MRIAHWAAAWLSRSPVAAKVRKAMPVRPDRWVQKAIPSAGATEPIGPARATPGRRANRDRPAGRAVIRTDCLASGCTIACRGNEVLVTAYCGAARNPASYVGERQATCGVEATTANSPLVQSPP